MPKKKPTNQKPGKASSSSPKPKPDISQPGVQRLLPSKPIQNPPPKRRFIVELLNSPQSLSEIRELTTTGASISTIEAILLWPPNKLTKLLDKGKIQKAGPYRTFYKMFRSWAAQARHRAEATLNVKSPEKWLDRSTTAKVVESDNERLLAQSAPSNPNNNIAAKVGAESVLAAMRALAEQGIDLNEAIRKDQIHLAHQDILEENDKDD